jgi:hypothetical protein
VGCPQALPHRHHQRVLYLQTLSKIEGKNLKKKRTIQGKKIILIDANVRQVCRVWYENANVGTREAFKAVAQLPEAFLVQLSRVVSQVYLQHPAPVNPRPKKKALSPTRALSNL